MLSLYIQGIYQGYTIIYFRICKFIQWIYFVVPIHAVYIPGITIIYFRICKFIQWIYFVVPIHTVHTMDIPFLTPRRSSTYDKPRYRDPGLARVFFMCPARPSSTARRRLHLLLDPDSVRADGQPWPSARYAASPEQEYRPLAIDCLPGLWPSDDMFHVSCTALTQWRVDDHICCWILNSDWKPARRTRVLQLEIPWRGRAPKLSTPRR